MKRRIVRNAVRSFCVRAHTVFHAPDVVTVRRTIFRFIATYAVCSRDAVAVSHVLAPVHEICVLHVCNRNTFAPQPFRRVRDVASEERWYL